MNVRARISAAMAVGAVVFAASSGFAQVGKNTSGVLDPNIATEQQLLALPGMNATIVKSIIDQRPFLSMLVLDSLLGKSLSREQRTALYPKMFIAINLNTAPRPEVLLVPGVGNRMAHEFEEYRPYKGGLAQFRKEIGKYVTAEEVARFEQYVFVPVNLNTASDADILSIPGVGQRMLREFKEYRPYRNIEQFRKEIGKYVNAKEVARLERYVTLE